MAIEPCISLTAVAAKAHGLRQIWPAIGTHAQGAAVFLQPIIWEPLQHCLGVERPYKARS